MGIGVILFFVGLSGLIVGSITDLQRHEVPDWINYGLMISGIGLRLLESVIVSDYWIVGVGLVGLFICWIIGLIMFYTGQWGGGDSKMLMGLGAIYATSPIYLFFEPNLGGFPILLTLVINIIIFGGIYGMIWALILVLKNFKSFKIEFEKRIESKDTLRKIVLTMVIILLGLTIWLYFLDKYWGMYSIVIVLLIYFGFYLSFALKAIEKTCMYRYVKPAQLVLGDWVVDDVMMKNSDKLNLSNFIKKFSDKKDRVVKVKKINKELAKKFGQKTADKVMKDIVSASKEVKEFVKEKYGYSADKFRVTGPADLGIEKEQIEYLIDAYKKGRIKTIQIKDGIPFVPSFLLAFVFTIIWGNVLFMFL